jgi:micrococcal nuclease
MTRKVLILLLQLLPAILFSQHRKPPDNPVYCRVTRIVDGDTFWAEDGRGKSIKVRLTGVDAPETHNTRRKLKSPYAGESALYLAKMIGGKKVRLEFDVSRYDQYGRTLAYVYLVNGTFVNAELVRNGYAMVMTVPPNVRYADYFTDLAGKARKHKRGLWRIEESPGRF